MFPDNDPLPVPAELQECLDDEPKAQKTFTGFSDSEKKYYIGWIYSAKKEETRIKRVVKTIERLMQGLKMYDKNPEKE